MRQSEHVAAGLKPFLARYRGAFLAVALFGVFVNVLMLTIPLYMLNVFSRVLTSRSAETLIMLTLAALVALAVQAVLDFSRFRVLVRVGIHLDSALSREVLRSLVRGAKTGETGGLQRLRDVGELRNFLTGPGVVSLFDVPFVPFYVAVIFLLHPLLGWVAVVGGIVMLAIGIFADRITQGPLKAAGTASTENLSQADNFLRNTDAVRSMGMTPEVLRRWDRGNAETLSDLTVASDRAGTVTAFVRFFRMLLQISLYAVGAFVYIHGEGSPGSIIAAAILMSRAVAPLESSVTTWKGVVSARSAYGRLQKTLAEAAGPEGRLTLPRPKGRLTAERVFVSVGGERMVVKGVSFDLAPGEMLGIIGASGAGKTSLVRAVLGLNKPRMGTVRLDGADVYEWQADDLGRYMGYLPQDVQLFPGTVAENIARMSLDPAPEAVVEATRRVGAHEMILRLPQGYDTPVGIAGMRLSAGQRQHVGLARAFFGQPCLVVLDEPNSNLDNVSEQALLRAMADAKAAGTTLVVITHRPSILGSADRMLVLNDGAVEAYGSRAEVMARYAGGTPTERPYPVAGRPIQRPALTSVRGDAAG